MLQNIRNIGAIDEKTYKISQQNTKDVDELSTTSSLSSTTTTNFTGIYNLKLNCTFRNFYLRWQTSTYFFFLFFFSLNYSCQWLRVQCHQQNNKIPFHLPSKSSNYNFNSSNECSVLNWNCWSSVLSGDEISKNA